MGFAIQMMLVDEFNNGQAISCIIIAAIYFFLSLFINYRKLSINLFDAYLALTTLFLTIAIPLWLNPEWTLPIWAIEGSLITWMGLRQKQRVAIAFGLMLQLITGFWSIYCQYLTPPIETLTNPYFLSNLLIALAGFNSSFFLEQKNYQRLSWCFFAWALCFWLFAGLSEIAHFASYDFRYTIEFRTYALTKSC